MKQLTAYMIVARVQPIAFDERLPIYWSHSVAVKELKKHGGTLVKVKLEWQTGKKEVLPDKPVALKHYAKALSLLTEKSNQLNKVKEIKEKLQFHFERLAEKYPSDSDVGTIGASVLVELSNLTYKPTEEIK